MDQLAFAALLSLIQLLPALFLYRAVFKGNFRFGTGVNILMAAVLLISSTVTYAAVFTLDTMPDSGTVSYTHLDVYKRQAVQRSLCLSSIFIVCHNPPHVYYSMTFCKKKINLKKA